MANERELIVDLHIPYCIRPERCSTAYGAVGTNAQKDAYMRALQREVRAWEGELDGYTVRAIRLGGGSASVMSPDLLGETLSLLRHTLPVASGAEVSYDALPNTIGTPSLTGISAGRPTRVELMMRSVHDRELQALDCAFDVQDVRNAMLFLNKFRVGNVSLTISLGIPGQTEASWRNTLHACVIMKPAHITIESLPEAGAQNMPDKQERFAMYASACDYLQQNGYTQYSAGHFCLPGREYLFEALRRNGTPIVGMGVNSVSMVDGYLTRNTSNLGLYIRNAGDFEKQTSQVVQLDQTYLMEEYIWGRMGLAQGMLHSLFESRFGQQIPQEIQHKLESLASKEWLDVTAEGYIPTTRGLYAALTGELLAHP